MPPPKRPQKYLAPPETNSSAASINTRCRIERLLPFDGARITIDCKERPFLAISTLLPNPTQVFYA